MRVWAGVALTALYGCGSGTQPVEKEAEPASKPPAKIVQFYASPAAIPPGEGALLCYGVESATAVRLDPDVDRISPSLARCIEVRPKATIEYTLFATGADGAEAQAATTVTIDPRAPRSSPAAGTAAAAGPMLIQFFTASAAVVPAGGRVTICYGLSGAKSVSMSPAVSGLQVAPRACFNQTLGRTTTFTLTAMDAAGNKDSEKLTIRVE
jgi:hypothetical protein